ncbi:cell division protein ZapB [Dechloromonas sp. CZR5]|uniref:cell division protein ZapB n=1 Tax=Dechloromonas sp. CZR5 TaxID=2608630 RepID=UPI00123C9B77|nr:cell division protein ZapB [Dechloromonas sp. CZR5]
MAAKKRTTRKKSCNRIPSSSKRSDWAAWMNGAPPEWLHTKQARDIAQAFDGYFPAWFIESAPWRPIDGARFKHFRAVQLGLSIEQCACYLRIHRTTIRRWESDAAEVTYSAFEALRLLALTASQSISHKAWDGWFINRQTGELICPDNGRLAVKPEEIKTLPLLYNQISIFRDAVTERDERIAELEAENITLRNATNSRQVAAELEAIRERITGLLSTFHTAEIIKFNQPADELRRIS